MGEGERHYWRATIHIFMADAANKYPENVPGKYFVDNQCIDCDLCRETAPDNFKRNEDGGYSFVFKQPEIAGRGSALQGSQRRLPRRSHRRQRRLDGTALFTSPRQDAAGFLLDAARGGGDLWSTAVASREAPCATWRLLPRLPPREERVGERRSVSAPMDPLSPTLSPTLSPLGGEKGKPRRARWLSLIQRQWTSGLPVATPPVPLA